MRQGRDAPPSNLLLRALLASCLMGLCWPAAASGARGHHPDKAKEVAQKVYVQGVDHYRAGRWLEALAAFRASYEMVRSPNSHLMIARTLRDRGSLVDAYLEYGKVVTEAEAARDHDPKYDKAADNARAERAKLRERLTMVTVHVNEPPEDVRVQVGDQPIDKMHWGEAVPILSGAVVARATAPGRPDQRQEVVAVPGGDLVVTFDFAHVDAPAAPLAASVGVATDKSTGEMVEDPSPFPRGDTIPDIPRQPPRVPSAPPDRTLAYVSFGFGAAGLATFVTFGAINQAAYNDLQKKCPGGHCDPSASGDVDRGRRAQTIANIGFGAALVGGTLGCIVLVSTRAPEPKTDEVARRPGRVTVTDISVAPHGLQVGGVF